MVVQPDPNRDPVFFCERWCCPGGRACLRRRAKAQAGSAPSLPRHSFFPSPRQRICAVEMSVFKQNMDVAWGAGPCLHTEGTSRRRCPYGVTRGAGRGRGSDLGLYLKSSFWLLSHDPHPDLRPLPWARASPSCPSPQPPASALPSVYQPGSAQVTTTGSLFDSTRLRSITWIQFGLNSCHAVLAF